MEQELTMSNVPTDYITRERAEHLTAEFERGICEICQRIPERASEH